MLVQKACRGKCEPGSLNGVDQEVGYGDDLVLIQVVKGLSAQMRVNRQPYRGADPTIKLRRETGVGPLSGKGPRVIVSADVSILPYPVFVRGGATGAALKEHLNSVCSKYFVPEEVHPQLLGPDDTMQERPAGKVGMYTRFFDYVNYRIPFSNFFVSVLIHFRIPFSQLSVFCSAKNGWSGFTKCPNVRACYSKNLDSVKNWNDHFFWVDEFVVPANARFNWISGSNISKDRAPAASEYNAEHAAILITHVSLFLSMRAERVEMDLNAFIRTADPRKVKIVERARAENEEPIVTVAKHRTVTPLPTSVVRPSGDLSESIEREFGEDVSGSAGRGQEDASVGGYSDAEPIVPVTAGVAVETGSSRAKRPKKRVAHESGDTPAATHPPKRLRADYGNTSGSVIGGKSPGVLNRLLRASQLTVEQGVTALPTLPFITSSMTASPLEEGGGHTDSATASALRTVGPSERFVVLSDSSHYSSAKSADAEVDSLIRSVAPVMTAATTVTTSVSAAATTAVALTDVNKDKNVPTPSIFAVSSSSEKTDRTLSLFAGRSGSDFVAGSIRAEGDVDTSLQEVYIPKWTVTKGFELNDGRSCANMIDHFTPPAFFKTVRGIEHEQLFAEFNVSAARNLSLSSEEERSDLLQVKDKEIEELKSQLLQARDESMEVAQLRTRVASLKAFESSLQGKVASAKEHKGFLEQERSALNLKVTSLESTIGEKDHELSDLETSSSSLRSHNQRLVDQIRTILFRPGGTTYFNKSEYIDVVRMLPRKVGVCVLPIGAGIVLLTPIFVLYIFGCALNSSEVIMVKSSDALGSWTLLMLMAWLLILDLVRELETSSAGLREKLETYEGNMKQLEEFQDNLMKPLEARLTEIDVDLLGRRWLLVHGMRLLMAKCLNSSEYMEALRNDFGRVIEKGMQEGLAAGIEHGQAGRCLNDLEAYNPSAEDDFNSAVQALRSLDFLLLQELSAKRDASTLDVMDLLCLDDVVAEVLGMTGLQPDVSQLMVPVCRKQDQVVVGSQTLSVALDICHGRVRKMERNLTERLPILKDVFTSIDHPLSVEALTALPETFIEPPFATPATNVLSTVVIRPTPDSFLSVEDYENPHLADAVPGGVVPEPRGEGKVEGSNDADVGDPVLSQLEGEARDAVL
ncbi:hypothetical protein Tco_1193229 [Tanacetum coccineum]